MKIFLLSLLFTSCLAKAVDVKNDGENIENDQSPGTTTEAVPPNYDYIVQMAYNLDETKVPQYLIDIIFDMALQDLTTDDILTLFRLKTLSIDSSKALISSINISPDTIFSLEGLDNFLNKMNLSFKNFYGSLKTRLNLGGKSLRDALVSLGINSGDFSDGLAFGEPDPYTEFKKGDFSKAALENACSIVGITIEDLFSGVRDVVISTLAQLEPAVFVGYAEQLGVDKKKSLELWKQLNVTTQDVYNVQVFRNKINNIDLKLKEKITLGVVTGNNNITINRKTYDIWRNEEKLLSIHAESLTSNIIYQVTEVVDSDYKNIVVLKFIAISPYDDKEFPHIHIGVPEKSEKNCDYITLENGELKSKVVDKASHHRHYFEIPKGDTQEVILGSPLVCNNKVYGIARDIAQDRIVLDSYSGVTKNCFNMLLLGISLFYTVM